LGKSTQGANTRFRGNEQHQSCFLVAKKLKEDPAGVANMYAGSITLGVGQFCTNPGLIIGIDGSDLQAFMNHLSDEMKKVQPGTMLHEGISRNYHEKRKAALSQSGVENLIVRKKYRKHRVKQPLHRQRQKPF
jgi:hypothetical protein